MIEEYMYIELKTGFNDDGPAWIGKVKLSKTKRMVYFNDHAFLRFNNGYSNYYDIESRDKYWITGLKKDSNNRHWAGNGIIQIDRRVVDEYLKLIGSEVLNPNKFKIINIEDNFPVQRISKLLNRDK